jgi:hypothetical protein
MGFLVFVGAMGYLIAGPWGVLIAVAMFLASTLIKLG